MSIGVAVTGMGIISAIGNNVAENFYALQKGVHGLDFPKYVDTRYADQLKVGEVKVTNQELESTLNLPQNHTLSRTAMLGVFALKQAIAQAQLKDNLQKVGFISSTSVGGMDLTEKYFLDYNSDPTIQKYISSHNAGQTSIQIAEYFGLNGLVSTLSTACSSAANAIMMGARLIKSGKLDRVIVGGTDALSKFTINGFKTLMILTDQYNTPFDADRKGLNLGEAAAYLVLEREDLAKAEGKQILAQIVGYGNANDAYHQTASSETGEGAYLAMQKALKIANLEPVHIDYVNVHGTATPNNDLSEGRALERIFGKKIPIFSSTKPFTGHTLAAAAAIEAVYSILALQHQCVYPNLNFKNPMPEVNCIPQTEFKSSKIQAVLSNSFGFGGNCSTLIFTK